MTDSIINVVAHTSTEDYTQSANTLFHFMKQQAFLENALINKALYPRFCREDVKYLGLNKSGQLFEEIAVLQKCFCDIPLHKIATNFELELTDETKKLIEPINQRNLLANNNHPEYYGHYAMAFSKRWCETKNLQPIHYLNPDSSYTRSFISLAEKALNTDELDKHYVDDILQRLSLIKPLRGKMKRTVPHNGKVIEIEVIKNFHDEQEWRYIPDINLIHKLNENNGYKINSIIANPKLIKMQISPGESFIDSQSDVLRRKECRTMWLDFNYNDIRYIIVPDNQARIDIINLIINLPDDNFLNADTSKQEKYILISKILVLDEIRKDW